MRLLLFLLALCISPVAHAEFSDVTEQTPYADAIRYVESEGIVSGYSDGTFHPEREINRAEFTKIIVASSFALKSTEPAGKLIFRDVRGNEWFAPYIQKAVDEGIIQGYGAEHTSDRTTIPFYPTFRINFAEAAKIITLANHIVFETSDPNAPWWEAYTNVLRSQNALPSTWAADRTVTRGEMAEMIYALRTGKRSTQPEEERTESTEHLSIPILVYHHVRQQEGWSKDTWSWKMTVEPVPFDAHMKHLIDRGYTSIDLTTLTKILNRELAGPLKPVVITFDDNNLNAYEVGVPIMEKYGITATFYQVAGKLDTPGTIDREKTLDLLKRGFTVESHTMTHRVLTALTVDQIDWEFRESKRILEEFTGRPILHVAYPGTAHNATVRERARLAGYITGSIMDPRNIAEKDDLFKLPRIMMTDDTNLDRVLP